MSFSADHQLAGESAALFHIDRTRHDIAVKCSGTADRHDRLGHDLARHFAPNLDRAHLELPKKLHVSLFPDQNRGCCQPSRHLAGERNSTFSMHCRLPRILPSMKAERQTTLLLLRSPDDVT